MSGETRFKDCEGVGWGGGFKWLVRHIKYFQLMKEHNKAVCARGLKITASMEATLEWWYWSAPPTKSLLLDYSNSVSKIWLTDLYFQEESWRQRPRGRWRRPSPRHEIDDACICDTVGRGGDLPAVGPPCCSAWSSGRSWTADLCCWTRCGLLDLPILPIQHRDSDTWNEAFLSWTMQDDVELCCLSARWREQIIWPAGTTHHIGLAPA